MTIPCIRWQNLPSFSLQQSHQLKLDWDRLNDQRSGLPFLSGDAIISALNILGDGSERLLVGTEGASVLAMFLLSPQGRFRWQTFQPSQLPLGAWVADPCIKVQDIARSLTRGPLGLCLGLSVTQIDPHIAPRTEDNPDSQSSDYIDTGWIDIEGSFEEYWNARGKNLRQNMRKQRAKLLSDNVKLTMQVLRDHKDMASAVERYGKLESAGWKAQIGTAIHPQNAQGRYYREVLEHASLRGEAVVYQFLFDDRVVAMNLCLFRKGTLVVLKTTYDETIRSFSPAFLLRESELQEIFAAGHTKRMEYFGRLMEWHTKMTDRKRTLYHITVYRWPLLKKIAKALRRKADARNSAMANSTPLPADESRQLTTKSE